MMDSRRFLTTPELRDLALDYVSGKLFTDHDLKDAMPFLLGMVFSPLYFMDEEDRNLIFTKGAMLYEYMDRPIGTVEGYPVFTSIRILWEENWDEFQQLVSELQDKSTGFFVPESGNA